MAQALLDSTTRKALQWSATDGQMAAGAGQILWELSTAQLAALETQAVDVICNADGTVTTSVRAAGPTQPTGILLPPLTALPAASLALRGQMVTVPGPTALVADAVYICVQTAGGTFAWHQLV